MNPEIKKKRSKQYRFQDILRSDNNERIDSPFAKYNKAGKLFCALCNTPVKHSLLWSSHLKSKVHLMKLQSSNEVGSSERQVDVSLKRKTDPIGHIEQKIFKLSNEVKPPKRTESSVDNDEIIETNATATDVTSKISELPEGFFDNPKTDAKVRNVEYKDKMDTEWELFQKMINQESHVSEGIELNDDLMRDAERSLIETDELIYRWSKIEQLHELKDKLVHTCMDEDMDSDDSNIESEFNEMMSWRSKS